MVRMDALRYRSITFMRWEDNKSQLIWKYSKMFDF